MQAMFSLLGAWFQSLAKLNWLSTNFDKKVGVAGEKFALQDKKYQVSTPHVHVRGRLRA